jgi:superfamily II DNA/RNA helicase/RecB family exonuclease
MTTAFELLHPSVQRKLWDMNWTELRSIQDQAIRHFLMGGGDAVISSPTASGKTEAAFLPVLSAIADTPGGSVRAMYIGPLKALINDQFRRLEDLCARMEMPVCKWHGDVNDAPKRRLLASPAGVLLITPESLEAMLVLRPTAVAHLFGQLRFVVIDEMHAFMGTERGAQLVSQLYRLTKRAACDPIRIGLSATLGEPETARRWMRPGGEPAKLIQEEAPGSALQIRVRGVWRRTRPDPHGDDGDPAVHEAASAILVACHGKTNLVFANAKSRIEELADALVNEAERAKLTDEIVVHHGSLSKESRLHAEERLREAGACTAVCSNTLELGIDIGSIDEVVQVSPPWSVASLVQRVGRSGRRDGAPRILRAFLIEQVPDEQSDFWDRLHLELVQGLAIIELMLERFIEPPAVGRSHLSTLIHQCLAYLAETGGVTAAALYQRLRGSGAFGDVSQSDFAAILREIGRHDLVEQMGDGSLVLGLAGQRVVESYTFYAAFNAPEELRVVHGADEIGSVARAPNPGEHLILAGRRWRVDTIDGERREILVSPARGARVPSFLPSSGDVHPTVHAKMKALLTGSKDPVYLDAVGREMLQAARAEAAKIHGFDPPAAASGTGTRLFVFGGAKVQRTLSLVLSKEGLDAADTRVGFDVHASAEKVVTALRAFAAKPDLVVLAAHADRVLKCRQFGSEKFEPFVAPEVWRGAYAREQLDKDASVATALALADALTVTVVSVLKRTSAPMPQIEEPRPALAALPPPRTCSVLDHPLEDVQRLCDALEALPAAPDLPLRLVVVPDEAHAHAIRRELARGERSGLLVGTRFITSARLAEEIVIAGGATFETGEEDARPARLRSLFRNPPALRYFRADQLRETPGWEYAFARTIGDLESSGLTPETLAGSTARQRILDVADIWAALNARAENAWTRPWLIREASQLLARDPSLAEPLGQVLVAFTGHEAFVDLELARSLPHVTFAPWAARPRRVSHIGRVEQLLGPDAARSWAVHVPPHPDDMTELGLLKAHLFEDPSEEDASRPQSQGRDGTVDIEAHDSVEAEIDAAVTWVQLEVTRRGTPLEELALVVPHLDPVARMLVERLEEIGVAAHAMGGVAGASSAVGARLLTLVRALSAFLHRDALIDVVPLLRVDRQEMPHLTRSEAIAVFGSLGTFGGTRVKPEGALDWLRRLASRVEAIDAYVAGREGGEQRDEERKTLARIAGLGRLVEPCLRALVSAAEPFLRGAPIAELWPSVQSLLRDHVVVPADGVELVGSFVAAMKSICARPVLAAVAGQDAPRLLEDVLLGLRVGVGRFGEPLVTIGTLEDVAGIPFTAVRVLGAAEGVFPPSPREDPVLPDTERHELRSFGLRSRADAVLQRLHSFDRLVRNTHKRFVLSCPRRDLAGTYRELSSVAVEVSIAVGRTGSTVADGDGLRESMLAPAHAELDAFRDAAPFRESAWQLRAAQRREVPHHWTGRSHLDLTRGLELLDPARAPDSLDGIMPSNSGWFPLVPGLDPARPLSASRWRTFLECPHRFAFETLLGFKPPPELMEDGAFDSTTYGSLFHAVMERFYRQHGEAFVRHEGQYATFYDAAEELANGAFSEWLERVALTGSAIHNAQRERLRRDTRALLEHEWELSRERVVAVERGFGTSETLTLRAGPHSIYVRGYIDRIDVEGGVGVLRDLKTGKSKPRKLGEIDCTIDAQLALYALVGRTLQSEWGLPQALSAAYVYPAGARVSERAFQGVDFELLVEKGARWLESTSELALARAFPRTDDANDCRYCAFKSVCGTDAQTRAEGVLAAGRPNVEAFRRTRLP